MGPRYALCYGLSQSLSVDMAQHAFIYTYMHICTQISLLYLISISIYLSIENYKLLPHLPIQHQGWSKFSNFFFAFKIPLFDHENPGSHNNYRITYLSVLYKHQFIFGSPHHLCMVDTLPITSWLLLSLPSVLCTNLMTTLPGLLHPHQVASLTLELMASWFYCGSDKGTGLLKNLCLVCLHWRLLNNHPRKRKKRKMESQRTLHCSCL